MPALFAIPYLQLPSVPVGAWNSTHIPCGPSRHQSTESFRTDRLTHGGFASAVGFASEQLGCLPA